MADGGERPGARGQKIKLLDWANDQQQLDMRTKYILKELASYADAECCAWSKVETLAYAANCSERTVQYHLARLKEGGLIVETDRRHRLDDSTRTVPIYRLAADVEGLGKPGSMGAIFAPMGEAMGAKNDGYGCNRVAPPRDHGDQESSDELSPGAGEGAPAREIPISEIEAAMPRRMVAVSDRAAYRAALEGLAAEGVDLAVLPGCLRRWGEDPLFVGKKVPIPFETWLTSGRWRGSMADDAPVIVEAAEVGPTHQADPGEVAIWLAVMAAMQTLLGAGPFGSYLGRASLGQVGERLFVVASSTVARDWIRNNCRADLLAAWGRHDPLGRELTLVSKSEFEALMRQGS